MSSKQGTFDVASDETAAPWKDRETLRHAYHAEGMTQTDMAARWNTTASTISYWMKKFGIDTTHSKYTETPDKRGPEFCMSCGENRTPGGSASANQLCTECLQAARDRGAGHNL